MRQLRLLKPKPYIIITTTIGIIAIIINTIMNTANTIMNASINTLGRQVDFMSFDVLASQDIASKLPPGG